MKNKLLQLILIIIIFMFTSCMKVDETVDIIDDGQKNEVEQQENFDISSDISKQTAYNVAFSNTQIIGTKRAIVSFEIIPQEDKSNIQKVEVFLVSETEVEPLYINIEDDKIYAVFDRLTSDAEYSFKIQFVDNDEEIFLEDEMSFSTPSQLISMEDVDRKIDKILLGQNITQENSLLLGTQACMSLLGFDIDEIGTYGLLTQANIVRLEYSFNSCESFVDISNIYGQPTQELFDILKNILSVSGENTGENLIRAFTVAPHPMTEYAKRAVCDDNVEEFCSDCEDFCGEIDAGRFIYDLAKENKQVYETYVDFPYIIETKEFETKYEEEDFSELRLELEAAQNKAMFSLHQSKWLKTVAVPKERIISVAGADDDSISLSTMIALSYMTIDAYHKTGQIFKVRSGYRTYNLQEKIHYKATYNSKIDYWRNLNWYRNRQKVSAAPGFSNHQYGVAIDFEGKYDYGINSFTKYQPELYVYLLKNGPSYGFYRNSRETWHWAYLGKTLDNEN